MQHLFGSVDESSPREIDFVTTRVEILNAVDSISCQIERFQRDLVSGRLSLKSSAKTLEETCKMFHGMYMSWVQSIHESSVEILKECISLKHEMMVVSEQQEFYRKLAKRFDVSSTTEPSVGPNPRIWEGFLIAGTDKYSMKEIRLIISVFDATVKYFYMIRNIVMNLFFEQTCSEGDSTKNDMFEKFESILSSINAVSLEMKNFSKCIFRSHIKALTGTELFEIASVLNSVKCNASYPECEIRTEPTPADPRESLCEHTPHDLPVTEDEPMNANMLGPFLQGLNQLLESKHYVEFEPTDDEMASSQRVIEVLV